MRSDGFEVFGGRAPSGAYRLVDPITRTDREVTLDELLVQSTGEAILVQRRLRGLGVVAHAFGSTRSRRCSNRACASYPTSMIAWVASYALLVSVGRLSAKTLGLDAPIYDPQIHFERVKDKKFGLGVEQAR